MKPIIIALAFLTTAAQAETCNLQFPSPQAPVCDKCSYQEAAAARQRYIEQSAQVNKDRQACLKAEMERLNRDRENQVRR